MLKREIKSDIKFFVSEIMLRKMKAELNQHRYYLDQQVEQRTGHLLKRIAFLESCNTTLCDKLAASRQELARFRQQASLPLADLRSGVMTRHVREGNRQIQLNEQLSVS